MNAERILNDQSTAPYVFTLGTIGRGIRIYGGLYTVRAWDLRQAIRETRKIVSKAWTLRLVRWEREGWK